MTPVAYPDPPLQTERIRLRPFRDSDIPAIVTACRDPECQRFMVGLPWPYGEADARQWFAMAAAERQTGHGLEFAIADRTDDTRLLGTIGPTGLDSRNHTANVGYWTAPDARGRGYQSEALGLLARWLFHERGIERLELTTAPDNLSSQRVARAAGFRLEGYGRGHLAIGGGRRRDSMLYALLPGDLTLSSARPQIVWLNGTFGAGKSSAAQELKRRRPDLTVYDPEFVGFILREFVPVPTGDFQDLPEWREGVAAIGASLARHHDAGVLAPMTVWRREYLQEIFTGLQRSGVEVPHVLIDAPDDVLNRRIDSDPAHSPDTRAFRRARLADYSTARGFLRASADLVIDSADLSVAEVADRIEPLLG